MELKDSVVLITGSSEGIGAETAKLFAQQGAHVIVTYSTNKKKAQEIFNDCNKFNEAMLIELDVREEKSIKNALEKIIDKFGAIDILVNNAGVAFFEEFHKQSLEKIDLQIDVNLKGLIKMTKFTLPYLQAQEQGIIINIASGAGKSGFPELVPYCATKFGVRGFTKALNKEIQKGIRTYVVNPGMTSTKMTNYTGVDAKDVAKIILKTSKESLNKESGEDIDVWEYL